MLKDFPGEFSTTVIMAGVNGSDPGNESGTVTVLVHVFAHTDEVDFSIVKVNPSKGMTGAPVQSNKKHFNNPSLADIMKGLKNSFTFFVTVELIISLISS